MTVVPMTTASPYTDNREHLAQEFAYADSLLRARVAAHVATLPEDADPGRWGMLELSPGEVADYLASDLPMGCPDFDASGPARAARDRAHDLRARIDARLAATPAGVALRLRQLLERFGLGAAERDVLLLTALVERSEAYRRLMSYLHDDGARHLPSPAILIGSALAPVACAHFARTAPLRRHRLIELAGGPERAFHAQGVRLDPRVLQFLAGDDHHPAELAEASHDPAAHGLPAALVDHTTAAVLAGWLQRLDDATGRVVLNGAPGSGRTALALAVAERLGRPLLALAPTAWPTPEAMIDGLHLALREAQLTGAVLLLAELDAIAEQAAGWQALSRWLADGPGPIVLSGRRLPLPELALPVLTVELPLPSVARRVTMWGALLEDAPVAPEVDRVALARELANAFQFTPGQMRGALRLARDRAGLADEGRPPGRAALLAACRAQTSGQLLRFGQRVEPRPDAQLEDLVLPLPQARQLDEIRARLHAGPALLEALGFDAKLRLGRGFTALFAGPSGTGKTMAAELLAKEQGVDLYKVDLGRVVSKWLGESEKNISAVFAEARSLGAVVFFDEADALFGKRADVKDARDRWANLEVNHLLQELEGHDGVVILASNLRQNMDEAFLRRIQAVVEFPFPDPAGRLELWRRIFPRALVPPAEDELRQLATRLPLTGGSIKNIAIDAALRAHRAAAAEGEPERPLRVPLRAIVAAAGREFQKLGKPILTSEFGAEWHAWLMADLYGVKSEAA